jgi:hypothetical protein
MRPAEVPEAPPSGKASLTGRRGSGGAARPPIDRPRGRLGPLGRHPRVVLAVVVVTSLVTLYVLTQVRTETSPISFTFATCPWTATSCAGNPPRGSVEANLAPTPGADLGFGWFSVPSLAEAQGIWLVSGAAAVTGWIFFGNQVIAINGSSNGFFSVAGPAPFTYGSLPPPLGAGTASTWLIFDILSSEPVTVSVTGTYFAPPLPDGWTS